MKITKAEFNTSSSKPSQCPKPDLPEFAFIGRSNVGKSSLTNMLTQRKSLAKTSGAPGKTKLINHFLINDDWYLVDLPGYGYAKVSKTDRQIFMKLIYDYFEARENMVNAFVLVDSRHEPQKSDLDFMYWLGEKGIPFSVVMTKVDKLSVSEFAHTKDRYHTKMLETWEELPPFFYTSATGRTGKEELLNYIDDCIKLYKESL